MASLVTGAALVCGSCAAEGRRVPVACATPAGCQAVHFAFTSFTGQRVKLQVDDTVVIDDVLETANWSTALSGHLEHSVSQSSRMKLMIDGRVVYDGGIAGPQVRTIYIDPRHSPVVWQTDHPSPLLD